MQSRQRHDRKQDDSGKKVVGRKIQTGSKEKRKKEVHEWENLKIVINKRKQFRVPLTNALMIREK